MLPATIVTAASSINRQHSTEFNCLPIALFKISPQRLYSSSSLTGFATPPKPLSGSPAGRTLLRSMLTCTSPLKRSSLDNSSKILYEFTQP